MGRTYRVAIIGLGAIATMHARALRDLARVELVGGCCRREAKGRQFVAQFGGRWFADFDRMLDEVRPDFATIATPSGAHLEPLLACARRGIHVLCEKPLEITTARVDRMLEAAASAGIRLGGIFPQRFNPVVVELYQAAAAGRFGSLSVVNAYVPWWRDDAYYGPGRWQGTLALDGGGALINQSIHGIDALQWIAAATMPDLDPAASPVEQVFAYTARRGHDPAMLEVEDTAVVALRLRNGALGQVLGATSMYPGSLKRLQVAGSAGTAEVLEDQLLTWSFRPQSDADESIRRRFAATTRSGGGASDPMAIDYTGHTRNIAAFVQWLDGERSFMLSGPEARKAVAIVEAIYRSAAEGRPVNL